MVKIFVILLVVFLSVFMWVTYTSDLSRPDDDGYINRIEAGVKFQYRLRVNDSGEGIKNISDFPVWVTCYWQGGYGEKQKWMKLIQPDEVYQRNIEAQNMYIMETIEGHPLGMYKPE